MLHPRFKLLYRPEVPFQITQHGHLYEVESCNYTGFIPEQLEGVKRKEIEAFSSGSRRRLIKLIRSFGAIKPIFLTLTYDDPMPTCKDAKADLFRFMKKLERKWPDIFSIWRLEFQKAGRVHFHLLLYSQVKQPYLPKDWIQSEWRDATGRSDLLPRVEKLRSHRGGLYYCAKYLAKDNDTGWQNYKALFPQESPGRFWGFRRRGQFNQQSVSSPLSNEDYKYLMLSMLEEKADRSLRRELIQSGNSYQSIEAITGCDDWDDKVKDKSKELFKEGGCPTFFFSDSDNAISSQVRASKNFHTKADLDETFVG